MSLDPVDFHRRAVQTPSHEDVGAMREVLLDALRAAGHDPRVDGHGSVLAARGTGHPHTVLNTHLDTVAPHLPYERDGDVVRGRGSCDAKGPLAALLAAFDRADVATGRITLAVTPDEETEQAGAVALAGTLDADGYVVGEPTGLDVCTAARGQCTVEVTLSGRGGHAADPANGANAIDALEPVLAALHGFDAERGPAEHPRLGSPTLSPTLVAGGEARNRIPAECTLTVDRRSVPPETTASFVDALEAHLAAAAPADVGVSVDLLGSAERCPDAFATDEDADLVGALAAASGGDLRAFEAATEASHFAPHAPTAVFGPGDLAVAHGEDEHVSVTEVERAADAVTATLESLHG